MEAIANNAISIIMSMLAAGILGLVKMYYQGLEFQKELEYIKKSIDSIKDEQKEYGRRFHSQDLTNQHVEEELSQLNNILDSKPRPRK